MKAGNIILIIQVITMYIAQLPFYGALGCLFNPDFNEEFLTGCLNVGLLLLLAYIPLLVACYFVGFLGFFKDFENPSKTTLICKLALIPWFVFNFVLCAVFVMGFLNPFLFLAIPILIGLMVVVSWNLMFASGIHLFTCVLRRVSKGETTITSKEFIGAVLQFVFVLDIVGAFLAKNELSRTN